MYRTAEGQFEAKRYQVIIQVPSKPERPSTDKLLVLGEATLDLAQFAPNIADVPQKFHMAVPTKLKRTAHVHGTVTVTIVQAKMALDGMTNMSRYSGNTGPMSTVLEQVSQLCDNASVSSQACPTNFRCCWHPDLYSRHVHIVLAQQIGLKHSTLTPILAELSEVHNPELKSSDNSAVLQVIHLLTEGGRHAWQCQNASAM